ncbi:putative feruloyl esterase [Glonium stellatum]|uniref:Carboxylic ester hydrolase n=1 Tax=Glonium stellatum TaxID=574774 RepID=A0A8E2JV03_9PEZI|nr:putative feruloyl esterase [Glonium stellatum]
MRLQAVLVLVASYTFTSAVADSFQSDCSAIASGFNISNATVWFSEYVPAGTNLSLPENNVTCALSYQVVTADICRVVLYVATSTTSGISMEAWLPRNWTGRFLSTGNGGLAGCIGYADLAYTTGLGFSAVGANNGHNGTSGGAFYNQPEVIKDFAYRSIHTNVVVGKQISKAFYQKTHTNSYYFGCSTGGRQGLKSAQDYPEDFDGIVAGSAASAFNNLTSWSGHFFTATGPTNASTFILADLWPIIHKDILKQCDTLDGAADGILEDPSLCLYRPEGLLCAPNTTNTTGCLTTPQISTVRKIFSPIYGPDRSLTYPRMQPGSELLGAPQILYNGEPFSYTVDWFQYAVYNDTTWNPATLSPRDYAAASRIDPGNIQTWNGDLSPFRARGGKLLTYHGMEDQIITSENSARYYEHVIDTMAAAPSTLDSFYRYFRISGMGHCAGGEGAWSIGQTSLGPTTPLGPSSNVLMALVQWVENGTAPETIRGTKFVGDNPTAGVDFTRKHCRYPFRNYHVGPGDPKNETNWECIQQGSVRDKWLL